MYLAAMQLVLSRGSVSGILVLALACAPRGFRALEEVPDHHSSSWVPRITSFFQSHAADPIALRVVYPAPEDRVRVRDSSFLFGSVASGNVDLTINGSPVRVWPNGAWLAWLAFPAESVMEFKIQARRAENSAELLYPVRRDPRFFPAEVRSGAVWIDSMSLTPRGQAWIPANENLTLSLRASDSATVRVLLPDGSTLRLTPQAQPEEVLPAVRAFEHDTTKLVTPEEVRYVGVLGARRVGPDPGPTLRELSASLVRLLNRAVLRCVTGGRCPSPSQELLSSEPDWAVVEAALRGDTVRVRWPLQVALLDSMALVTEFNDDTTGTGQTDSTTPGRAVPGGAYQWFFPTGTRALVSARLNDDLRIRLSPEAEAWVPVADARPLPPGLPAPQAVVSSVTVTSLDDRVALRIPLTQRVPFQVSENERSLSIRFYGAVGDVDWIRYANDPLLERLSWNQVSREELTLTVDLAEPVWGYRAHWSRNDLVFEVRRPPRIRKTDPLRNRLVALDPGHPPLGATGPTGLREADANLAVALRTKALLEKAGARVLMTRTADSAVDLWARVAAAERSGAELLISIHNNALPDGVNPFTNNGTSVFYNQPRSLPFALEMQKALVKRLKLPDLGVGRADLALVRPTWMPAVLSEGMFIILPDQEKALRSAQGQQHYALGVFEGVRAFLARRAEGQLPRVGQPRPGASPKAHPNSASRAPAAAGRGHGAAP
jgi:N-acetylmuramoyl-L-alanine amidase